MDSSNEEETRVNDKTRRKSSSLTFAHPLAERTRSSGNIHLRRDSIPTDSEVIEDGEPDPLKRWGLTRSRSEDATPRVREQWGSELWNQGTLQESMTLLQSSVAEYEKEASQHQWKDLLKINADVADLGKLADGARKKKARRGKDDGGVDGLSKFSTVAIEYSKMLDVVMNQAPEYAGLAWGAIRMLLVAHTNHSKLKHAVEHYIIQFGQDFGVINHLMSFHPTEKMVEAVCDAYTAFSKFLAKAIKYYKESRMMSAIKAFGFPWETRFQGHVTEIEAAFKRIKEIASAGHFGMTAQTHQMIATIGVRQDTMRHEMRRNTTELREQLKFQMKEEMQTLFQTFDRNWISRFEQIMIESIHGRTALGDSKERGMISFGSDTASHGYAETIPETLSSPVPTSTSFLADHVSKPKRLKRFRDKAFVHLQKLNKDHAKTNARLRQTSTQDLHQIISFLRRDRMRAWLQASSSSLIWINTVKRAGPSDWATTLAIRIVEYAGRLNNMAVLYHLCGNHSSSSQLSTPTVMVQSLIMQLIEQCHLQYVRKVPPFTLEHFQYSQDDVHDLWALFLSCCAEAKAPCIWLIVDHFDNLMKGEDYDFIVDALLKVAQEGDQVFKIFLSARTTSTPNEILEAAVKDLSINTVTVPKASPSAAAAILSRQKRVARLPDDSSPERPPTKASKAEIDALLHSSSEDEELSNSDKEESNRLRIQRPGIAKSGGHEGIDLESNGTDGEVSDSSMEFMRDNLFATTDEDDQSDVALSRSSSHAMNSNPDHAEKGDSDDEDQDEFLSFAKRSRMHKHSRALDLSEESSSSS